MSIDRRTFVQGGSAALGYGALLGGARAKASETKTNELYADPLFKEPFIEIDEWRDEPVRHRYVFGGFKDTDLRFAMYFPPEAQYQGRFFHPLMHIAGQVNVAPKGRLAGLDGDSIPFAAASGAYLVESNLGSNLMTGPADIVGWRASAATAQYSRILAAQMYGQHRPYGYIYGGSGGAYKTLTSVENTKGIWDGAVPFIHGSPVSLPNVFTVQAYALRVLDGKFEGIVDAISPGGSGDMYAGLNDEQKAALEEVTRMGFPPRAWFAHDRLAYNYTAVLAAVIGTVFNEDPQYFQDFWKLPGYLGANPPQSLLDARIQHNTSISGMVTSAEADKMGLPLGLTTRTHSDYPAGFKLASLPQGRLQGCFLIPKTGAAAGERLMILDVFDDLVMIGYSDINIAKIKEIKPGDKVDIDNSDYLAVQTYHRHQMPPDEFYVWEQFKDKNGKPIYPQRPLLKGYDQAGPGHSFQSGRFDCKMIVVDCLMDEAAYPWQADWYRKRVKNVLGNGFEDQYRLWYVDHAMHVNPTRYLMPTEGYIPKEHHSTADAHIISYSGVLQQALRDVAAWAEKGVAPPTETSYRVVDSQIQVPAKAAERKGVQPTVAVTANGGTRAEVKVGETVAFTGNIEVPPGTGAVVTAEWDFDGSGAYPQSESFSDGAASRTVKTTHAFDKPGTYFPALRVAAQRNGDAQTPFARVQNLGRVRVVVS